MEDRYLDYPEAAQRLGLKINTLYALVYTRRIPHVRMGRRLVRFSTVSLDAWVKENTVYGRSAAPSQG